ncbi:hypothetical protein TIFTF001_011419 [Ficus carica]|uniref:Uncharacterized protein n=1 Tax=Ficus carica TaxID=3494 RepID=A0AA87ZRR4_FICCA|nr:hypothetical protein TIFTF001_011419 [Ficus carica]
MGRSPCCDKVGLKKGPWTPEEDQKLLAYIEVHGHGSWRALPAKAGLQRCGKSCRLRWTNYLRPDIKRGKFSLQEEQTIIQLHALLGNRWSAIATHLPKRTDNEIKNYWNTHLKKRLAKMGIDPVTHKPKNDLLSNDGAQSKNASNLSHMAQWESARLEAEARLVRESKLRNTSASKPADLVTQLLPSRTTTPTTTNWNNSVVWSKSTGVFRGDLESPTSTLTFSEKRTVVREFVGSSSASSETGMVKEEGEQDWKRFGNNSTASLNDNQYEEGLENSLSFTSGLGGTWTSCASANNAHEVDVGIDVNIADDQGFTSLLLNSSEDRSLSEGGGGGSGGDSDNGTGVSGGHEQHYHDNDQNYWNSILNLVNSSPSDSPMF